ncbi:MAG TPA: right-handed parallel beta-helix repeat-containing protein [Thermoleophilaceae bacterium]|nr:right-handed parallel beta-helix repeat-containing protein [Thermoleophilaceae bacterium]
MRIFGLLLLVLAVSAIAPQIAVARTLVVDDDRGCTDARFSTIQSAVDAARPLDTVVACPGVYTEAVSVTTRQLKLVSRTRHAAVIRKPLDNTDFTPLVLLAASGTLFRGFALEGAVDGSCGEDGAAIWIRARPTTVDENRIADSGCNSFSRGIFMGSVGGSGTTTVAHNEVTDIGGQCCLPGLSIHMSFPRWATIHSNVIRRGNGVGMGIFNPSDVAVQGNRIEDTGSSGIVTLHGSGVSPNQMRISGNRIEGTAGHGIRALDMPVGLTIEANTLLDNVGNGIMVERSPGFVHRNRSLGNGIASGLFDCFADSRALERGVTWKDNIGRTDDPANICRAP